ncbi:hypothetical protein CJD36_005005 [Flavipsychrobacter stenotrophus]|uniref:Secretion system C-terminal sorting domain-containing protein n=1 Tax=Flavipsychrobacter stenotrophus TaxID=2077091 RepID=A0A2S7T1K9_9BACT|nr:T9SS type A sorting domain-containing protein [Flavipsychrobacter stenotrophus]PQJ13103.1 hypothetical protein CJD36_005005 [Flavipsychrobacter stenotrophus]
MKKLIIAIVLICGTLGAQAQKIYFTDTSNTWKVIRDSLIGGTLVHNYADYHVVKDSVVGGHTYHWYNFDGGDCSHCGSLVREDTAQKKVFLRYVPHDSEIVLFNYNLHLGDTFIIHPFYDASYVVTDTIITMINGIGHKAWEFARFIPGTTFAHWCKVVEGIGNVDHPTAMFRPIGMPTYTDMIYCFHNNGTTPPLSPNIGNLNNTTSCTYYPSLDVASVSSGNNDLELYPNPVTGVLTITSPFSLEQVVIINFIGKIMVSVIPAKNKATIDVSSLPAGIYFARINGMVVRKFVKE